MSSAFMERFRAALNRVACDWDWKFSHAPEPGQPRIQITGQKIGEPEISRTIVFSEELCKTLSVPELARHVVNLLPALPMKRSDGEPLSPPAMAADLPAQSLDTQYLAMRKCYAMNVSELREKAVSVPSPNLWLSLFGMSLQNLQRLRK